MVVPDAGRVTVTGEPAISQLPLVNEPIESTLMGADEAAVVGSGTMSWICVVAGADGVSAIAPTEVSSGTIMNGTGFDSAFEGGGF
jgi:hypothetical protein